MTKRKTTTRQQALPLFWTYFNVADEIDESRRAGVDQTTEGVGTQLTLADLDRAFVLEAQTAAIHFGFPWPPHLAVAEDYALDHPEFVQGKPGW